MTGTALRLQPTTGVQRGGRRELQPGEGRRERHKASAEHSSRFHASACSRRRGVGRGRLFTGILQPGDSSEPGGKGRHRHPASGRKPAPAKSGASAPPLPNSNRFCANWTPLASSPQARAKILGQLLRGEAESRGIQNKRITDFVFDARDFSFIIMLLFLRGKGAFFFPLSQSYRGIYSCYCQIPETRDIKH